MSGQFDGKTALVTGGGTGIGRAAAIALAAQGAIVTVAGRTEATLEQTVEDITGAGGSGRSIVCDVTDEDAVRAAVAHAMAGTGRLDLAVNSAGIDGGNLQWPTVEYPNTTFESMLSTNVTGTFYSMKHELAAMLAQGHGSLVNIASSAGLFATPGYVGYHASKFAQVGMTKSAALDYAKENIRINAICPALVDTPLIADMAAENPDLRAALEAAHPIGRIADPAEIADAVVWLCSQQSTFVTGLALPIDGGYTAQ